MHLVPTVVPLYTIFCTFMDERDTNNMQHDCQQVCPVHLLSFLSSYQSCKHTLTQVLCGCSTLTTKSCSLQVKVRIHTSTYHLIWRQIMTISILPCSPNNSLPCKCKCNCSPYHIATPHTCSDDGLC